MRHLGDEICDEGEFECCVATPLLFLSEDRAPSGSLCPAAARSKREEC